MLLNLVEYIIADNQPLLVFNECKHDQNKDSIKRKTLETREWCHSQGLSRISKWWILLFAKCIIVYVRRFTLISLKRILTNTHTVKAFKKMFKKEKSIMITVYYTSIPWRKKCCVTFLKSLVYFLIFPRKQKKHWTTNNTYIQLASN